MTLPVCANCVGHVLGFCIIYWMVAYSVSYKWFSRQHTAKVRK